MYCFLILHDCSFGSFVCLPNFCIVLIVSYAAFFVSCVPVYSKKFAFWDNFNNLFAVIIINEIA